MSVDSNQRGGFCTENHSRTGFEPWIIKHLCEPLVKIIPARVHPNTISLVNHFAAWMILALAATAPQLPPFYGMLARISAGLGVFTTLLLDCLDGMHARRTGQSNRLGEVMDHWLDAMNVPIYAAAFIMTLSLDPWLIVFGMITGTMPYNAQLILYHNTGRFVHPTTTGVDAQVYMSAGFVAVAVFFFIFPREAPWVGLLVTTITWIIIALNLSLCYFYWVRIRSFLLPHIGYLVFCGTFSALYLAGMMNSIFYTIGICTISFRLTGSYVLYTVLGRQYNGIDWRLGLWVLAIAAGHYYLEPYQLRGFSVTSVLPPLFIIHISALNLRDLLLHKEELKPSLPNEVGSVEIGLERE